MPSSAAVSSATQAPATTTRAGVSFRRAALRLYVCAESIRPIETNRLPVLLLSSYSELQLSSLRVVNIMNFDDVLFGLILCGIGLAGACFRSEYVLLRELRAIERRREKLMRELHIERLSSQVEREHFAQTG